jgi:hypothetical protein
VVLLDLLLWNHFLEDLVGVQQQQRNLKPLVVF